MTNEQIGRGKLDEGKRSVVFGRRTEVMMKNEDEEWREKRRASRLDG